jgi:hypothetical protein
MPPLFIKNRFHPLTDSHFVADASRLSAKKPARSIEAAAVETQRARANSLTSWLFYGIIKLTVNSLLGKKP